MSSQDSKLPLPPSPSQEPAHQDFPKLMAQVWVLYLHFASSPLLVSFLLPPHRSPTFWFLLEIMHFQFQV